MLRGAVTGVEHDIYFVSLHLRCEQQQKARKGAAGKRRVGATGHDVFSE